MYTANSSKMYKITYYIIIEAYEYQNTGTVHTGIYD